MSINSEELAAKVHEQLSKMDVRPTSLISEKSRHLRPQLKRGKRGDYTVVLSDESVSSFAPDEFSGSGGSGSGSGGSGSARGSCCSAGAAAAQPASGSALSEWFNWKIAVALVIVTIIAVFVYKKWFVIQNLGVGYAIADTPGLEGIGTTLTGRDTERVKGELDALKSKRHPVLPTDDEQDEVVHFADEKDQLIDSILSRRRVKEAEAAEAEAEAKPEEDDGDEASSGSSSSGSISVV